ncbi:hypothetical protein [Methanocalculus sp.]|uniref:hypothetical protein n=1 Tax=Methanocalculus sp. TaxID=2004547 RepID=UPI0027227946|nr:hypothetical protein [Methanocalculus sp.]MDO8842652.1 hypothetical protein [Methanocalculus sp.]
MIIFTLLVIGVAGCTTSDDVENLTTLDALNRADETIVAYSILTSSQSAIDRMLRSIDSEESDLQTLLHRQVLPVM